MGQIYSSQFIPSEGECQPISQSPCHQHDALGQPYSPQCLFVGPRAGSEIYRDEENDADGEGESKEDGYDEVGRSGPERQEVAEKEEDEGGDGN